MFLTPTKTPYADRLQQVASKAAKLHDRAAAGEPMGPRELAQAIEYSQQYYDILCEMEDGPLYLSESNSVKEILCLTTTNLKPA